MAVVGSGAIRLGADIGGTFGDSAPYSISEFYRGGALVPASIPYTAVAYEGPLYDFNAYYWQINVADGGISIGWGSPDVFGANVYAGGGGFDSISIGGYVYYRGAYQETLDIKGPVSYLYAVGRYYYYTAYETVNTGIPGSGQVRFSQFYGGRKT